MLVMSRAVSPRMLLSLGLLPILAAFGCAGSAKPKTVSGVKLDYIEQREHVKALCRNVTSAVISICRDIETECLKEGFEGERKVRRRCAAWQTGIIEECRSALELEDPRRGMIDLWTLAYQYREIVEEGEVTGKAFKKAEPIVVEGVAKIFAAADRSAREFFEEEEYEVAKKGIEKFIADNPTPDGMTRDYYRPTFGGFSGSSGLFGDMLGTRQAAEAVDRIAVETDQAAWLASWMPLMMRLQTQILLMDLAEVPLVVEILGKLDEAQQSIVRLDEASQRMPKELETTFVNVFRTVNAEQGDLRDTLGAADKTVVHMREALGDSQQLVESVNTTMKEGQVALASLERVAKAWQPALENAAKITEHFAPDKSAPQPENPTSLSDQLAAIERTAQQLAVSTQAASEAIATIQSLVEKDKVLAKINTATEDTINRAFWNGVLLIGFVLLAAVIYKAVAGRLAR